jgi:hypothetical protein
MSMGLVPPGLAQGVVINEIVADNSTGLQDEDGQRQDWVELYNGGPVTVSLLGWQLLDNGHAWTFPATTMEPGSYLIVFCSDKNRAVAGAPLHTGYGLSKGGEYLALKMPDGQVATEFNPGFPSLATDVSYGLQSGGGYGFFSTPSPGEANFSQPTLAGAPALSLAHGLYSSAQSLAITYAADPLAEIRYTTNGATPTASTGTVYTAPIAVSATSIIRARAFREGYAPSGVATRSYIFPADVINQVYLNNTAPPGWPLPGAAQLNGQTMRYGLRDNMKALYTDPQLIACLGDIPTVSLVTDQDNLTGQAIGIYSNARNSGDAWERPVSAEWIPTDGSAGFQIDCGIRIRGGASRHDFYPKHSFRLYFRASYGASQLEYPVHGTEGVDEFDVLELRTEQHNHWANDIGTHNTAVREVMARDLSGAMGLPYTRSRPIHLYLNGQYWGLYQTQERAQEDYAADYHGGDPDDYDVVQADNDASFQTIADSGDLAAWQQTWNLAEAVWTNPTNENYFKLLGRDANGVRVPSMPVYIDPDILASTMLLYYYTGDGDAVLSSFQGYDKANNWRGFRKRGLDEPWRFIVHDAEQTLGVVAWVPQRAIQNIDGGENRHNVLFSNHEWIHRDLMANAEFKTKMGDMVQKHLRNGGALSPERVIANWDRRAAEIDGAIAVDSARWGTNATNHSLAAWTNETTQVRNTLLAGRGEDVLAELRWYGYYPHIDPPTISPRGGEVAAGTTVSLTENDVGDIYYTLDGSDPRAIGGAPAGLQYSGPIPINSSVTLKTRFLTNGGYWSALDEATFSTMPRAVAGKLVVSKFHYHPTNPTDPEEDAGYLEDADFEYLELQNISAGNLNLQGVTIGGGVDFSFSEAAFTTLAAGGKALVVENAGAFVKRYGPGLPVAGAYSGKLADGGEYLRVADHANVTIVDFTYDDVAPWPAAADGDGPALVLNNPSANPAHGDPANWRASTVPGGVPGAADTWSYEVWRRLTWGGDNLPPDPAQATQGDADLDGTLNLTEFVTRTPPLTANSPVLPVLGEWTDPGDGKRYQTLTWRVLADLGGINIGAVTSPDLLTWPGAGVQIGAPVPQGDGTALITFRDTVPLGEAPGGSSYIRLTLDLAP